MFVGKIDTTVNTLIQFIAPTNRRDTNYYAIKILFADDFDLSVFPKSARVRKFMTIDCTPKKDNAKNETGLKRFARIRKALEGHNVIVNQPYTNSVTEEEFMSLMK